MVEYIGLIRKDEGSDYSVEFPDFPGCVSAGATIDGARKLGAEALQFHIDGMLEDGEELPPATALELIMRDPQNAGAVAFLVPVEIPKQAAVRVNVTFAGDLLKLIDVHAARHRMTRSGFLAEAAVDRIRHRFTVFRWTQNGRTEEHRLSGHYGVDAATAWARRRRIGGSISVELHRGPWDAEKVGSPEAAFQLDLATVKGVRIAAKKSGARRLPRHKGKAHRPRKPRRSH